MRIFHNLNVDFMAHKKKFYLLSAVIILAGIISMLVSGLHFGIDFKGGLEVVINFDKKIALSEMRAKAKDMGIGNPEIKTFGENGILIRTELQTMNKEQTEELKSYTENIFKEYKPDINFQLKSVNNDEYIYKFDDALTAQKIVEFLLNKGAQAGRVLEENDETLVSVRLGLADFIKMKLSNLFPDNEFEVIKVDKVGPKVGDELKGTAIIAIVLSILGILIYLAFRFKFIFAVGAVVALFHDVLITFSMYILLYDVIPGLNLEITLTVLAAFLTLVGYSVNDTVIVFDRIREQLKIYKNIDNLYKHINDAINKTMSRTILTGSTTLLTIVVLLLFGGEVLRAFAFTLIIGIITGTYSSIFVASAIVLDYAERIKKKIEF
ncbi:MAG TPA: protein translocase subunit SecF [Ignavibacteriales bacterium]|nr:protein translocase subunit SecF [Ignavibacteriales bacterium]HOL80215.1 protein translocase subunit SecF [Ignavibacteriales bacterium]HPP32404.1 protein translocase subunit SecF [Ignavibacteriales bacterium]